MGREGDGAPREWGSLCGGVLPLGEAGAKPLQAGVVFKLFGWPRLRDPEKMFGSRPLRRPGG